MYIPKSFAETDAVTLYQFMRANNFATLVTSQDNHLTATHLPFMVDSEQGVLKAHLARANDQWKNFERNEALVIFQGPHAYISPGWYEVHPSVPTWNYASVHVYGIPHIVHDEQIVRPMLRELVQNHEQGRHPEWEMNLPEDYMQKMLQAIVVFEIPLTRIEGKFKLSQNRSETDQANVIEALANSNSALENQTARLMRERSRNSDSH